VAALPSGITQVSVALLTSEGGSELVKVKKLLLEVPVEPPPTRLKVMTGAVGALLSTAVMVSLNVVPATE
jgi:hypothetical protein